jgi:hypothetical protein
MPFYEYALVIICMSRLDVIVDLDDEIRIVDMLSSHLALLFMPPLDPVWAGLRLIPLAILAPSNGMSCMVWRPRVVWFVGCGRLAGLVHGWVSPIFGLSLGSSDLWMCTSSAEFKTHSNGRVLSIRKVMVWTSHVDAEYGDLRSYLWLCYFCLDDHCYSLSYYRCYITIISMHLLIMAYLSIILP